MPPPVRPAEFSNPPTSSPCQQCRESGIGGQGGKRALHVHAPGGSTSSLRARSSWQCRLSVGPASGCPPESDLIAADQLVNAAMAAPSSGASATAVISHARDRSPERSVRIHDSTRGVEGAQLPEGRAVHRDTDRVPRISALAGLQEDGSRGSPPPWPRPAPRWCRTGRTGARASSARLPCARGAERVPGAVGIEEKIVQLPGGKSRHAGDPAPAAVRGEQPARAALCAAKRHRAPRYAPEMFFSCRYFPGFAMVASKASSTGPEAPRANEPDSVFTTCDAVRSRRGPCG